MRFLSIYPYILLAQLQTIIFSFLNHLLPHMPRLNHLNFSFKQHRNSAKTSEFPPIQEPSAELILPFAKLQVQATLLELGEEINEQYAQDEGEIIPIASNHKIGEWTLEQNVRLNELHNELGNRWSLISKNFEGKSDNCVKNNFFSRMRMALRHLNKFFTGSKTVKPVKQHIISKITSTCEQRFKHNSQYLQSFIDFSYRLKNSILSLLTQKEQPDILYYQSLMEQIHQFNRRYKMRREDTVKNPKASKRNKKEAEVSEDQNLFHSTVPTQVIVDQDLQDSVIEQEKTIKQEWNSLDTILRESCYLSQLFGQRIEVTVIEADYLCNNVIIIVNNDHSYWSNIQDVHYLEY